MFIWPVPGPITRDFHYLSDIYAGGQHAAIDIAADTGTPIRAVAAGTVAGVGWDFYSGFFVAIDHADGWRTFYRHLYGQAPVTVGQQVSQGQIIGNIGSTGYSLGPHLHFDLWNAVRQDATAFAKHGIWAHNPELYLGKESDVLTQEDKTWITNQLNGAVQHALYGPKMLKDLMIEIRGGVPNDDLLAAIRSIRASGGGPTAEQIADELATRLKD